MRAANNVTGGLYGACPAVNIRIGDVEEKQHFFVQEDLSYPIILGQPFITELRMETKVLDDGSHFARIRNLNGIRTVQFQTVKVDHERNKKELRDWPVAVKNNEFAEMTEANF